MSQIVDQLRIWIEQIILTLGYPGITLIMLVENLFPPIPSELVMPFAGFLAARGQFNPLWVGVAGTLGSVLGAIALYYIGYLAGEPLVRPFIKRYGKFFLLSEDDLNRSLKVFADHGDVMVFFGRVVPIIRSLISLPAGMNRMPLGRFLLFTTLGSAIWTSLLTVAGMVLGANWERVLDFIETYQKFVLAAIVVAVVAFVARRFMDMRRAPSRNPS